MQSKQNQQRLGKAKINPCGDRLAALRIANNKTQAQVAAETGISLSAIQKYECNVRRPSDKHKMVLANYYKQDVADLFYGSFSVRRRLTKR
jgi:transcriptional regulator with XRE-family HTH domain